MKRLDGLVSTDHIYEYCTTPEILVLPSMNPMNPRDHRAPALTSGLCYLHQPQCAFISHSVSHLATRAYQHEGQGRPEKVPLTYGCGALLWLLLLACNCSPHRSDSGEVLPKNTVFIRSSYRITIRPLLEVRGYSSRYRHGHTVSAAGFLAPAFECPTLHRERQLGQSELKVRIND